MNNAGIPNQHLTHKIKKNMFIVNIIGFIVW